MRYIVTFAASASDGDSDRAIAAGDGVLVTAIPELRMAVIEVPADDPAAHADAMRAEPSVLRVEKDRERSTEAVSSDPRYPDEWHLPQIGWDQAIGVTELRGSSVVAILDTGVSPAHEDLSQHVLSGKSFVQDEPANTDPNGHGTWMAGIVAADTNNDVGVSGVAWAHVRVLPITVLGADGTGLDGDIVAGLVAAVADGADVILMSFSAHGYSAALQAAVDYAWDHDVVVVAAAGNDGTSAATYPAGDRGVIAVSGTDRHDHLAPDSNWGDEIFIGAPSVSIETTDASGGYASITGTSAAAAQVAAAAALIRAADPGVSNGTITARLARTAAPAGSQSETGNGRLDLDRALDDQRGSEIEPAGVVGDASGGPFLGPYVASATRTWTGGSSLNSSWTTASNWGGTAPVAGDALIFPAGAARLSNTNDFAAGTSFASITISGTGYTLTGNSVALGATGLSETATGASNTVSLAFSMAATTTFSVTDATSTLTVGGALSGSVGITKTGAGTLVLSTANGYTGATTLSAGVLDLQNATALGTTAGTTSVTSGAAIQVDGSGLTIAEPVTLNGTGVSSGGAIRNLANNNSWTGTVTLASAARVNSDAGTLTLSAITATAIGLSVGGSGNTTVSGVIGLTSGTLTKDGSGTLTLSGTNTYTGATTLSAGVLNLKSNSALGTTAGTTSVTSGAAVQVDGSGLAIAEPVTLNGTGISSGGALINLANSNTWSGAITLGSAAEITSAAGTFTVSATIATAGFVVTFDGSGATTKSTGAISGTGGMTQIAVGGVTSTVANTYSGATTISVGTFKVGVANAIGSSSAVTVSNGATFDLNGFSDAVGSMAGDGSVTNSSVTSGTLTSGALNTSTTFSGVISGVMAMTKSGSGTLILSGTNTYTGATTVSAGVIQVQSNAALGATSGTTSVTSGAAVEISGSGLSVAEPLSVNGTGISSGGALRNVANSNAWTGTITVATASRINSDGGTLTLSAITGTTFTLTVGGAGNTSITGNITLTTGGVTKDGSGTLALSGTSTYTGTTTVSVGVVQMLSNAALGATSGSTSVTSGAAVEINGSGLSIAEPITLNGSGISSAGALRNLANGNTWSGTVTLGSAATVTTVGGTLTLAAGVTTAGFVLTVDGAGNTTKSTTAISGTGGLTKAGSGTLTSIVANTYSGATTVSAGTLKVGIANAIGSSSALTVSGGATFDLNGFNDTVGSLTGAGNLTNNGASAATLASGGLNSSTSFSGTITDGATATTALTKSGTGTLTLGNTNTYSGITTISGGSISVAADANLGTAPASPMAGQLVFNGGTLLVTASFTLDADRGISLTGAGTFNLNAGIALTYGGIIAGSGALTESGSGTLTLSGNNTYSGATTVSAGTLKVGIANAIGSSSALTVSGGATFDLNGFNDTVGSLTGAGNLTNNGASAATLASGGLNSSTSFSGTITDGATATTALTKSGTGTLTLGNTNTYSGITTISGGSISVAADANLGTAPASPMAGQLVFNGGTLLVTASFTLDADRGISLTGAGTFNLNAGIALTYGGIIAGSGALTESGSGTLTLSGNNTYSGATTVSAGTLLDLQSSTGLGTTAGGTSVASGGAILVDGSGLSIAEPVTSLIGTGISTTGAIRNPINNNTWSGLLTMGAGGATVQSDAGTLTLSGGFAGNTRPLTVQGSGDVVISSAIATTTGTLTKSGSGTLTLSGANTYTGVTTLSGGILDLQSNAALGTSAGATSVSAGTAIQVDGSGLSIAEPVTLNGSGISAGGALRNLANSNTWSGAVTLGSASTVTSAAGTLTFSGAVTTAGFTLTIDGSGNTSKTAGAISGTGGLTKIGSGTLTIGVANSYSGATTIGAGTVSISADTHFGTAPLSATPGQLTFSGGTLVATATFTLSANRGISLAGAGTVTVNSGLTLTYGGVFAGGGVLSKDGPGTLTLTSASGTTGGITITAGSLVGPSATLDVTGDWTNNASAGAFTPGTGTIRLSGTSAATIGGSFATTFWGLTITDAAGITLAASITVNGTLTLSGGIVATGSDTLSVGSSGSVSRTSGHVYGNLRRFVSTGSPSVTYDIGDATDYAPLTLAFTSVTVAGNLTASTTAGDHPQIASSTIDPALTVGRYWTLSGAITFNRYDATFSFVSGDIDPGVGTDRLVAESYLGGLWSPTLAGSRTSTSTQARNVTTFGDFAIGELAASALDHFVVTTPASSGAWTAFDVTVTAADVVGNTVTGYAGSVMFSSTDTFATLSPSSYTFVTGDYGTRTFTDGATLYVAGITTISATNGAKSGTSGAVTVTAGSFARLVVILPGQTVSPGSATGTFGAASSQSAHTGFSVTVLSVDAWWNPVTSTDTIAISSSDALAVLPSNDALAAGAKAFSVTLETPGTSTVTASDVTDGTKTAFTSVSITVTNTAPTAVDDSYSLVQDGTLTIVAPGVLANDSDPEGQPISVGAPRPATSPSHGSVSLSADGSFDYTPDAGYSGSDSFTYSVTDEFASATATVTLTISASSSTYVSSNPWGTSFSSGRYLSLSFPAYVPSGADVSGAAFHHTYRSQGGGTTCYYLATYSGPTLLATHGSAGSPISCASGSWVTDNVSLPEVDTVAEANNLTVVLYVENSAGGYSAHRYANVSVDYDLP